MGEIVTRKRVHMVLAGLFAFVVYEISREHGHQVQNTYVWLADAFLHGRPDIPNAPAHLDWVSHNGFKYSHQGPLPAVLLMPFVLVFGVGFELRHFAALLGGCISASAWSLATRVGLTRWRRLAAWAFPVLGTTIWYESKTGHTWGVAALASALFLFLGLGEYFGRQRLWLIGLLIGSAGLCRPPAFLALFGFAIAVRHRERVLELAYGAVGPLLALFGYNLIRFGTITDKAIALHYARDTFRHQRPPGVLSFAHIPYNLWSWLFLGPDYQPGAAFLRVRYLGTALPLTSPAFITGFAARRERWLWLAALAAVLPAAMFYANGFSQFGMRYLVDIVPFLSALVFIALREGARGYLPLLIASIAVNAYGVAYTTAVGLSFR